MRLMVMDSTSRELKSPVRSVGLISDEMSFDEKLDLLRQARMATLIRESQGRIPARRKSHCAIPGTFAEKLFEKELPTDADLFAEMMHVPADLSGFTPITIPAA